MIALAGCGPPDSLGSGRDQTLLFNIGAEPETLDPALATGVLEHRVMNSVMDGLTRLDENGAPQPALAERWESDEEARSFTFHLREAQWSNGDPVTAEDFVWSWRRAINPATASDYAYQLYYIAGAEDIHTGKTADYETLRVTAPDARTLRVEMEGPTPFFPALVSHGVFFAVHRPTVEGNDAWHLKAETYVGTGPFRMEEWRQSVRVVVKRNPRYWNAEAVRLDAIVFHMIEAETTMLAAFESGQLDLTSAVPRPDIPRLRERPEFHIHPMMGTYFVNFNCRRAPFDNPLVRKAFTLAIDRRTIVERITQGGEDIALAWVPPAMLHPVTGESFRGERPGYFQDRDVQEARRALAEAGYPDGRGFPRTTYIFNTMEVHRVVGEALQQMWKQGLGVDVGLENQEWKTYLDNRNRGNFDLARGSWVADFPDPVNFLDVYLSNSGNNTSHWFNEDYDALIRRIKSLADPIQRFELMHQAEAMFMEDFPIGPIFFHTEPYLEKTWVRGVRRNALSNWDFSEAWIERP